MPRPCPFDRAEMQTRTGLPAWLDIERLVGSHPLPLLGGYVKTRLREAGRVAEQNVSWAACPRCGFIAFFEK